MSRSQDTKDLIINVNGKQASATINDLGKVTRKLKSDLRNLDPQSKEFKEGAAQLRSYNARLSELYGGLRNGASSWEKFKTTAGSVMGGVLGANMLQNAISKVGQLISDGKQLAEEMRGVKPAFDALNQPQLLANLREATKGTVSDLELMKSAVKANNFKIPLDNLAGYFAFATKRATETGVSVDYLTASIIDGISRKSLPILDNLGFSSAEVTAEMNKTGDMAAAVGNIIAREMGDGAEAMSFQVSKTQQLRATYENVAATVGSKLLGAFDSFAGVAEKALNIVGDLVGANKSMSEELVEEQNQLNSLVLAATQANITEQDRLKIIDEIQNEYPDLLNNIDKETVSNEDLSNALAASNEQYLIRIQLTKQEEKIKESLNNASNKLEKRLATSESQGAALAQVNRDLGKSYSTISEAMADLEKKKISYYDGEMKRQVTNPEGTAYLSLANSLNQVDIAERNYMGSMEEANAEKQRQLELMADLKKEFPEYAEMIDKINEGKTAKAGKADAGGDSEDDKEPKIIAAEKKNYAERMRIKAELVKNLTDQEKMLADEMKRHLDEYVDYDDVSAEQMLENQRESMDRHYRDAQAHYKRLAKEAEDGSQDQLDAQMNLLELQRMDELRNADLTKEERLLIDAEYFEQKQELQNTHLQATEEKEKQALERYRSDVQQMNNAMTDIISNTFDRQIQDIESNSDKEVQVLESKYKNNILSEEEYRDAKVKLEEEESERIKKIRKQQFIADKAADIIQAVINTALGITAALREKEGGRAKAIAAGIMGAVQVGVIASQPVPEFGDGGMLDGPSHSSGGVMINAEGGEAIINKKSTAMFAPMLSAINEAGGGKRFYAPGSTPKFDTGGVVKVQQGSGGGGGDYSGAANRMMQAAQRMEMALSNIKARAYITYQDMKDYETDTERIDVAGRL